MKPEIGDWGFITGSKRINQEYWDRSFPNGWFGRIIAKDRYTVTLRCYRYRHNRTEKNNKHPHLKSEIKYFKKYLQI